MSKPIKQYWPIAATLGLIAVIVLALLRPWSTPKTELTFELSPTQVDIAIDSQDYGSVASGEMLEVELSGDVIVEASREGFTPESLPLTVDPGEAQTVYFGLVPETPEAEELVDEQDSVVDEQVITEEYHDRAEGMFDKHPILSDLPQEDQYYGAYQGIPEGDAHDFAIHLHLYVGHEAQGREDFEVWMDDAGYSTSNYQIIEDIKDEDPPVIPDDGPSYTALQDMNPGDISMPTADNKGLGVDALALHFAEVSTTWDTAEDVHHTDGLIRAKPLMTHDLADSIEMPHRPTPSQSWWTAYEHEAKSYVWLHDYSSQHYRDNSTVEMQVCWAWVADEMEPVVDGPRTLEATVDTTGSDNIISDFFYEDPDDFVDSSASPCIPEDAS
ncbi:hypothetical protein [Enteractinococcus helveticum]|jgi:hypothetical protein|uniref:PEGA domain-containing protein n=1 Tax=Enteractinococcus helveticum TaxID=1837282 RepID=A0A1B7LXU1_9MICC|nr:hypothetical protein [Enteractinococcus helveticum]OAV59985.1 hypothetical protein A6F49_14715 [Enteractinococcus helveticum]